MNIPFEGPFNVTAVANFLYVPSYVQRGIRAKKVGKKLHLFENADLRELFSELCLNAEAKPSKFNFIPAQAGLGLLGSKSLGRLKPEQLQIIWQCISTLVLESRQRFFLGPMHSYVESFAGLANACKLYTALAANRESQKALLKLALEDTEIVGNVAAVKILAAYLPAHQIEWIVEKSLARYKPADFKELLVKSDEFIPKWRIMTKTFQSIPSELQDIVIAFLFEGHSCLELLEIELQSDPRLASVWKTAILSDIEYTQQIEFELRPRKKDSSQEGKRSRDSSPKRQ
jgi:hypothetical protein